MPQVGHWVGSGSSGIVQIKAVLPGTGAPLSGQVSIRSATKALSTRSMRLRRSAGLHLDGHGLKLLQPLDEVGLAELANRASLDPGGVTDPLPCSCGVVCESSDTGGDHQDPNRTAEGRSPVSAGPSGGGFSIWERRRTSKSQGPEPAWSFCE